MEKIFTQTFTLVVGGVAKQTTLEDILKQSDKTLLYFYPKNDTPGCTLENTDFTALK
jgi:peroxiredoxin